MKITGYMIDARDGREWDALLRARARNPATHSNVFGALIVPVPVYFTGSHIVEWGLH